MHGVSEAMRLSPLHQVEQYLKSNDRCKADATISDTGLATSEGARATRWTRAATEAQQYGSQESHLSTCDDLPWLNHL